MKWKIYLQMALDRLAPKPELRWGITALLGLFFLLRVLITNAFYLVTYAVGVYLVHALILFLTPKGEDIPDPFENIEDDYEHVNGKIDNEFRPFIRNLPEYDFWLFITKTVLFAFFATFFDFLDFPVYTPILVGYFIFMVIFTAKRLYIHMKKFNYNPFSTDKAYYKR